MGSSPVPLEDFSAPNIQFAKLTNKRIVMEQAGYLIIIEMVSQEKNKPLIRQLRIF